MPPFVKRDVNPAEARNEEVSNAGITDSNIVFSTEIEEKAGKYCIFNFFFLSKIVIDAKSFGSLLVSLSRN